MGGFVVEAGGTAMNDDDLLFGMDDLERWKKRTLPNDWLEQRMAVLIERQRAQLANLTTLMQSADAATIRRLNERL